MNRIALLIFSSVVVFPAYSEDQFGFTATESTPSTYDAMLGLEGSSPEFDAGLLGRLTALDQVQENAPPISNAAQALKSEQYDLYLDIKQFTVDYNAFSRLALPDELPSYDQQYNQPDLPEYGVYQGLRNQIREVTGQMKK